MSAGVLLMNHRGGDMEALAAALRGAGHRVSLATAPAESLRLLRKERPSVIVLDPLVQGLDGVEMQIVRSLQQEDDPVPVLVLADTPGIPSSLDEQVFHDFLLKPCRPEELVRRVRMAMAKRERYLSMLSHARQLEGQVIRDLKTGLYTSEHFRQQLRLEFQRAERHRQPLSFLWLDLDGFKDVNDGTDYAFGDQVLGTFSELLRSSVREIDHVARFGGDEFMILLPRTTPVEAVEVADRIRNKAAAMLIANPRYTTRITVSVGIATFDGRGRMAPEDLRRQANAALKEAKRRGKNRIWLYAPGVGGAPDAGAGAAPRTGVEAHGPRQGPEDPAQGAPPFPPAQATGGSA